MGCWNYLSNLFVFFSLEYVKMKSYKQRLDELEKELEHGKNCNGGLLPASNIQDCFVCLTCGFNSMEIKKKIQAKPEVDMSNSCMKEVSDYISILMKKWRESKKKK